MSIAAGGAVAPFAAVSARIKHPNAARVAI
jgi:hypothetical protein